jgi:hypothetical protein
MKMKQKNALLIIATVIITLIFSCSKDDFEATIGFCPLVTATNPTDGATNVPLNQQITATFNGEVDPATINSSSFTIVGSAAVAGTISYSGLTATFIPNSNLKPNTTYVGTITTLVKDFTGNALQEDYIWTFSTGATIRPMVASTTPTDNATNVVINKVVAATFNMPMDPSTITSSFTLKQGTTPITGVVTYSANTAFFTPASNLISNTIYTATITTGAESAAGTAIANDYVWQFTTGTTVAPKVLTTSPTNNENGVELNKVVTVNFDMAMDELTLTDATFTLKQGTTTVSGNVWNNYKK